MEVRVAAYRDAAGACPVLEFLADLGRSNRVWARDCAAFVGKLRHHGRHLFPIVRQLKGWDALWEVRPNHTRIFYFYLEPGQEGAVVLLCAQLKKDVARSDFARADRLRRDFLERLDRGEIDDPFPDHELNRVLLDPRG